jgi:hypothetical protein
MNTDDQRLQELAAQAYGLSTGELLNELDRYKNEDLPSYVPFLNRVREVLVTRYELGTVNHLLKHLSVPRRDTMVKNTGNLPT